MYSLFLKYKEFIMFLLSGGSAAFANIVSRYLLSHYLPYELAIILAYGIGMLSAFLLFRFIVFKAKSAHSTAKEIFWFILINIFALVQTLIFSIMFADYIFPYVNMNFYPYDIAHIIGVCVPVITSYFGHKYLTFGGKQNAIK